MCMTAMRWPGVDGPGDLGTGHGQGCDGGTPSDPDRAVMVAHQLIRVDW